mgnify:CR=1 FL=1
MDSEWVLLIEAENDLEADIICGFMQEQGIPTRKADSSPYTGAMRVIGGLAVEVQILVPENMLEEARTVLATLEKQ